MSEYIHTKKSYQNIPIYPVAERLRRAYPASPERAGVSSIPANSDAVNGPSFRRWRFEMKLSPFFYIPLYPQISSNIYIKDILIYIQCLYPLISINIFLYANIYPCKNRYHLDIPIYIQIRYPKKISDQDIIKISCDIHSYP